MDHAKQARIRELHNKLHARLEGGILHLLNGQAMQDAFDANGLMREGDGYAPFNEAMCSGEAAEPIFGEAFNRLRAAGHGVSPEEYARITLTPLQPLTEHRHSGIALWFGDDMFCQMNALTALAYLNQTGYEGKLFFHMVKEAENQDEIEAVDIPPADYRAVYGQVLIERRFPAGTSLMPAMARGIELFLEYRKPENEITAFIRENQAKSRAELLKLLFEAFPHYGLGDMQYLAIMEAMQA
ncbi:AraC family transcriptional regulator [Paenibacillus glycinis]|uniref:AraC family transcriptional regulator n=1 Tax=Paenibacillus glycinis TaxID=2697035 RepID=A0ABW9Y0P7_9BACL|nr:AraC family transcriptional regulator [Paenibacillus glycinis]NBD27987.1 AraC family transcriptional regulator [Paenibacillus glycinis]